MDADPGGAGMIGAVSGSRPTGQARSGLDASRIDPDEREVAYCVYCLSDADIRPLHFGMCGDCWAETNGQFGVGA